MRRTFAIALIGLSSLVGCAGSQSASKQQTPKDAAVEQWNRTRSQVLLGLASDQYKTGNYDKSRQTVVEALKMNPKNADLWVLSAKLHIEKGQLESAEKDLQEAIFSAPEAGEPHYLLGVVNQRWQRLDNALSEYTLASDKAPTEVAYVLARVEMLVALDRSKEALSLLQEKLSFFENNAVLRDAAGQLHMQQKQYGKAVEMYRAASLLATDDIALRERLAKALFFNEQHREASDLINRLLRDERNAERADLHALLGEAALGCDRPSEARAAFETAAQINPTSVQAWQGIAKVAMNINDQKRAEMAIRRAIAIDPADAQSHLLMGYLRMKQKKLPEAMTAFRKAAAIDQSDAVALCMTGYALEQSGDHQQAMEYYGKALRIKPGDELATKLMAGAGGE